MAYAIDTLSLAGNILGCYELDHVGRVTAGFMSDYASGLMALLPDDVSVDFDEDELERVCLDDYSVGCAWDAAERSFRKKESGHVPLSDVNSMMPLPLAIVVEAYTRWFVARRFKKENRGFMEYTRSMAQSACFAMDCLR